MIRLAAALLCDSANVRENLLSVLGGGITTLGRPDFPAPINCDLALSFYVSTEVAGPMSHAIEVVGSSASGVELFTFETGFGVDVSPTKLPVTTQTVSMVIPVGRMGVPEPGHYQIEVFADGETLASVPFQVEKIDE